jgi:hypothetical protein
MSTLRERGHALLKSLVTPHDALCADLAWRTCRTCLANDQLENFHLNTGLSQGQRELQAVLDHYDELLKREAE